MNKKWPVQDVKSKFSELLNTTLAEGPLNVTKRGVETAVRLHIRLRRRLEKLIRPDLKELLVNSEARIDHLTPPRRQYRRRKPLDVE
ncbi:MAG: type II toxin-antitoxin system prevent-host-death family antitoxin [Dehalococcoidia bacterium]|nr:type II toxin-antitoxin system prevent-host-death family antitoxin [Dehalococcoidia bacterium]